VSTMKDSSSSAVLKHDLVCGALYKAWGEGRRRRESRREQVAECDLTRVLGFDSSTRVSKMHKST